MNLCQDRATDGDCQQALDWEDSRSIFGSNLYVVEDYLPRYGVSSTIVDGLDLDQWRAAMRPNTKTCFLETPTNPNLDVLDIAEIAKIAHAAGATLIVDNNAEMLFFNLSQSRSSRADDESPSPSGA